VRARGPLRDLDGERGRELDRAVIRKVRVLADVEEGKIEYHQQ